MKVFQCYLWEKIENPDNLCQTGLKTNSLCEMKFLDQKYLIHRIVSGKQYREWGRGDVGILAGVNEPTLLCAHEALAHVMVTLSLCVRQVGLDTPCCSSTIVIKSLFHNLLLSGYFLLQNVSSLKTQTGSALLLNSSMFTGNNPYNKNSENEHSVYILQPQIQTQFF